MPASSGPVAVGYDTRFGSAAFARAGAELLASCGREVILSEGPCPTPAVSCQVVASGSPFGISITASHNPAEFNGLKIKTSRGGSAGSEITRLVEQRIEAGPDERPAGARPGSIRPVSFTEEQRRRLAGMVDLGAIRESGLRVAFDAMHGACGRLLESMLQGGSTHVTTLRANPDPMFGGVNPEPLEPNLAPLRDHIRTHRADIGLATDGDGDRIGAFDETGRFVTPLQIAPLLALRLLGKGLRGVMGKTYANTIYLDRIAKRHGLPFEIYPVGFKHIAERMSAGGFLIGGEESGGIGITGYLPERDGLLVSLMLLETLAVEGKPLSALLSALAKEYGELHYARRDVACPPEKGRRLAETLRAGTPAAVGGMKVTAVDALDGVKLLFGEEGWILVRPSGTEPVLRVYCEAPSPALVTAALDDMMERLRAL
jgi:phosphomannomutase